MPTIPEALQLAVQHHQAGRLAEAEQIYRQILALQPNHADAWHLLGTLAHKQRKHEAAIEHIRHALKLNPDLAVAHNNLGTILQDMEHLTDACDCYLRAIALNPDFAEAHYNLGIAYRIQKQFSDAAACFRRTIALNPKFVDAHNSLGNTLLDLGQLDEAASCFLQAIELKPDYTTAYNKLGNVFRTQGKLANAIACYRRALELTPNCAEVFNVLGNTLRDANQISEAIVCYQSAVGLQPDFAEAHHNLGVIFCDGGQLDEAISCFHQAIAIKSDFAQVHDNLGRALRLQGKLADAIACYRRALELNPNYAEAHHSLGIAYSNQGRLAEAELCFRRSLELKPDAPAAYNNLGNNLSIQGKLSEAVSCFRRALKIKPESSEFHNNLAVTLQEQGDIFNAVACYRRALEISPGYIAACMQLVHQLQHLCSWQDLPVLTEALLEGLDGNLLQQNTRTLTPFCLLSLHTHVSTHQQYRWTRLLITNRINETVGAVVSSLFCKDRVAQPKIKLAYLSADFHAHATAWLIAELFEKHDRQRFNISAYSYGPDEHSSTRQRLMKACDEFIDIRNLSFQEAAQRIANDKIDILIDLKGYTKDNRAEILAYRPAPIQVNYLGYPGTMGADFIDYILVDDFIVPPEQQPFFTEKLVHLPGCYQVNDSQRAIAERTPTRSECGLPEQGFVFCSFNNNYKITPNMFSAWMLLLHEVPGSVLWLYAGNAYAPDNLRKEAAQRGIAPERLVFAERAPLPEHLARHRLADLFLDTFPVTAHTTASDALWAGCPLLTLAGDTFISRVAGSLLHTIGLPELVTSTLAEYKEKALQLARNPALLAELRARLAANRLTSTLFNAKHFARKIEAAFTTMWSIHTAGETPRAFRVTDDMLIPANR